ncbi:MAG TPA: COX15/CtaA family protein, partial [Micromonosporaceae bacterium]
MRRLALASLVANVGIVVTGGAVRLSGSGLGCPTWPRCTDGSYVTTAARGYHGEIEFTNRTLTFVVGVLALLCVIAAWAQRDRGDAGRRGRIGWSLAILASIPAQAVLGGLSVLTDLNPWVVACHFLLSSAIITAAYQLWIRTRTRAAHIPA